MSLNLDLFLRAFRVGDSESVHLRALPPRGATGFSVKIATTRHQLHTDRGLQSRLLKLNESCGVYFVVNGGGDCDADITTFSACFAEMDDRPIFEQHAILNEAALQPSIRVETKKSVHAYWLLGANVDSVTWRRLQISLIRFLKSDPAIKNPSRLMRLPFFDHVAVSRNCGLIYKRITLPVFEPDRHFGPDELLRAFPFVEGSEGCEGKKPAFSKPGVPEKTGWDFDIRAYLSQLDGYHERGGWGYARCPSHQGKGTTSLFISLEAGAYGCFRGCSAVDIRTALGFFPQRLRVPSWIFEEPVRPPARTLDLNITRPAAKVLPLEVSR